MAWIPIACMLLQMALWLAITIYDSSQMLVIWCMNLKATPAKPEGRELGTYLVTCLGLHRRIVVKKALWLQGHVACITGHVYIRK